MMVTIFVADSFFTFYIQFSSCLKIVENIITFPVILLTFAANIIVTLIIMLSILPKKLPSPTNVEPIA